MIRTFTSRLVLALCLWGAGAPAALAQIRTQNVVLVTLDGARHQEIFGGLDIDVLRAFAGKTPAESHALYKEYWAPSPEERRRKLMPFFWSTLMTAGSIAGNPAAGSVAKVTNRHHFSYPGYAEILTGEAHDDVINSNDARQNPYETVLEFVRRKLALPRSQVAAFTSWGIFSGIVEHVPGSITSNAGVQPWPGTDPLLRQLDQLQSEVRAPWSLIRHDAFTFRFAMSYLKTERPRLLYLALDETDDWAHDGKYDLVLDAYARTDRQLRELWEWLQSDPQYTGRTTLLITTDHGRGRGTADWRSHNNTIPGADEIWVAAIGPDSAPRGEWRNAAPVYQNQIAATVASLFGLDLAEIRPSAGHPIKAVLPSGALPAR